MDNKEFKKEVQWTQGHRFLKLDQKRDKNGNLYLIGDLGYNNKVTVREMTGDYNKGKWEMQIIPIKYTKIEANQPPPQNDIVEAKEVFNARETPDDGVPF